MRGQGTVTFQLPVGRKPVPRVVRQVVAGLPLHRETSVIEIMDAVEELRGHTLTGAVVAQLHLMFEDGDVAATFQKVSGRLLAVTRTKE